MIDTLRNQITARRDVGAAAIALLAILCPAAPVAAQQAEQTVEFQSFRVPGWSLTPSVAIGAVHDNNVALTAPRADLGETQGDTVVNIMPGGSLEYLGRRTDFSVNYRGFVRRYMDVEGLDGFDQRASLSMRRLVSRRLTFYIRDSYSDTPTTDEAEVNGVPFRRAGSQRNTLAAGTEYRLTKQMSLTTRYDTTWVSFDRPDIFLAGGWIHGLRNELARHFSERVSIGGEYTYRVASLNDGQRDLSFQDAGGVVHFTVGPHTKASAAGGFAALRDRTAGESRTGPYFRVYITHALEYATLGAGFERQYVPSFGFGGSSASQELAGYVLMPLGHGRFYTQGSAAWRRMTPFEDQALELDTIWLRSTVGYSLARWARVEALYTFTRQDSIITGGEVNRHRAGIQFVISQPMRIP
jgi:hypothetical protein